ncbi:complement factor B [Bombina bombina]|uniref:complement factor B n=1 Tax=Bombina bombina TaxID=8345 RepID=UPI00235A4949|nr:complement factor B [Bombina bombina]XP_053577951.1 complement factor B [Bombina bombina]XP_053577952.1 complement factor B [Bombina bombina]
MWSLLISQIAIFSSIFTSGSLAAPPPPVNGQCDLSKVAIIGGNFTVSDEGNRGSVVKYSCPKGKYPYPAYIRDCLYNGKWTDQNKKAICKDVRCPRPLSFDGGDFYPKQNFYNVGAVLNFECYDGFRIRGSVNRTCQENAKWSGKTTICDDLSGDCPDPGIPIGTTKAGNSYKVENKVYYECQGGLEMFGSKMRQCQENHHWSGTEPSCRAWYAYDTPEEVAESFFSTLSANFNEVDPDKVDIDFSERKINIVQGGFLNIFIVLDSSKSVIKEHFETAKGSCEVLIEKISSFDIEPRYSLISYTSKPIEIVALRDDESLQADEVIKRLKEFNREKAHDDRQGTNTREALLAVYKQLSEQENRDKENFMKTHNVIVLMTDGKYNMGGDPREAVKKIRDILDVRNGREDFLDIYVFGLGERIDQIEINDLASKKDNEVHNFHLENADGMKKAFDNMIDEAGAMDMCGLSKYHSEDPEEKYPWISKITITRLGAEEKCKGSIVTEYYILTAAHCFIVDDLESPDKTKVHINGKQKNVKSIKRHPKYDPAAKQDKNIPKSFDYDLALIELKDKIEFSSTARPLCLPCTKSTSRALKMPLEGITCQQHINALLSGDLVKAQFIAEEKVREFEAKRVQIKQGNQRNACLEDAKLVKNFENVADIRDVVTDQFLCTGGIEPTVDDITCQGDSGGPLLIPIRNEKRFIQVGVISWGTVIHCKNSVRFTKPVPKEARDFHYKINDGLDWLKEILGGEGLEFLD